MTEADNDFKELVENGLTVIDGTMVLGDEAKCAIATVELKAKVLADQKERIREALLQAMTDAGVKKIDNDAFTVTRKEDTQSESFDKKQFRTDNPDLYDKYVSFKPLKGSLLIKLK